MKDVTNNKYALLNIKLKYNWFIFISILIVSLIIFATIYIKTYDTFTHKGIVVDKKIVLQVNIDDVKKILDSNFIMIDNKKQKFSVHSVSEIQYSEYTNMNYQVVILSTSNNYLDNLSLDITFYKNKQRIIVKLFNLLK